MRKLGYQFNSTQMLKLALTHRSKAANNYERLEFLGDSILGFVVAEYLYKQYPKLAEGKLSRMRSTLVRKETLAKVARQLQLSDHLLLGEGELKSGGFNRDSILSDTVESLIGAIYLDSDFDSAKQFIYQHFDTHFAAVSEVENFKDAKSRLQEFLQKRGLALPEYQILETLGEQHQQEFKVECVVIDRDQRAEALAGSRRLAEQKAASIVLRSLQDMENSGRSTAVGKE